ncbi:2-hydroxyglutaryl-CoA dehydratase, partial [Eubacteriales bacterium OttesenSCG-928-A19]|nr:2-hydroxyglutaryl-CoA dehydratase [Eubacteriales bacterium OttesenSCG-928-A19]
DVWLDKVAALFKQNHGTRKAEMREVFQEMADDFARVPTEKRLTYKVGIVGEIYVKYSPLGNNHLEEFLASEGCEVCMPGLTGFIQYCVANYGITTSLYGGNRAVKSVLEMALRFINSRETVMRDAIAEKGLRAPGDFEHTIHLAERFIGLGAKMGEGWLLTGEMAELVESGFSNIVCAQPFGCLPNHVVGRGMIAKLRAAYPEANIVSVDYDPSATRVNQENRIKLMLASAEKN